MDSIVPSPEDERLANLLHALGNPMRVAIIRYINHNPGCICNDLVIRFDRAQATVSQHLATLRQANVLVAERDGQATCYRINTEEIKWLHTYLEQIAATAEPTSTS